MRKVLGGVYRAETHAAGEGGEEERAVHDGEDAGRDWRGGLLQDLSLIHIWHLCEFVPKVYRRDELAKVPVYGTVCLLYTS